MPQEHSPNEALQEARLEEMCICIEDFNEQQFQVNNIFSLSVLLCSSTLGDSQAAYLRRRVEPLIETQNEELPSQYLHPFSPADPVHNDR